MSTGIPSFRQAPPPLPSLPVPLPPLPPAPPPARPWPVTNQRRPAAASPADPGRWSQGHDSEGLTVSDSLVGAVSPHREGGQGQSQDDDGSGSGGEAADETLDPRIRHIGDALAMVCSYEQAQVVWSARIPLDPELLQQTVLYVTCSPGLLDLRFETPLWEVRELLNTQLPQLRELLAQRLAMDFSISVQ